MKKGFTLLELLGVIIVLTILTLLILPNVIDSIKNSDNKSDTLMNNMIVSAAKLYVSDNFTGFIKDEDYVYCIPISKLVSENYLTSPVKYENIDDITGVKSIKITYDGEYRYNIVDTNTCSSTNYLIIQNQANSDEATFFDTTIKRNTIEKIVMTNSISIPINALGIFDVSELKNESIRLWYLDEDNNGLYEVYIGQNGGVKANANSKNLFGHLTALQTIDLANLDTSSVINMSGMFKNCDNLTTLDISNFETSNTTDMSSMFENCSKLVSINFNNLTTENLTNTTNMFNNTASLSTLNIPNALFDNILYNNYMFKYSKNTISITISCGAQSFIRRNLVNSNISGANLVISNQGGCEIISSNYSFGGTKVVATASDTHKGILYLNPTDLTTTCNEEIANNNKSTNNQPVKNGCMRFYIYDDSGETYKLILDHNTTNSIEWNSNNINTQIGEISTALSYDTRGWIGTVRLITADEIATITGANGNGTIKWNSTKPYVANNANINNSISWFYLDGTGTSYSTSTGWKVKHSNTVTKSKYAWLFDNTTNCDLYGCNSVYNKANGYWTSTKAIYDANGSVWDKAWFVTNQGTLNITDVKSNTAAGIRPVVIINKTNFN